MAREAEEEPGRGEDVQRKKKPSASQVLWEVKEDANYKYPLDLLIRRGFRQTYSVGLWGLKPYNNGLKSEWEVWIRTILSRIYNESCNE